MGVPQLLTAIGPKLTMSRAIAEQLIDTASARLGRATLPCDTAIVPLASAPDSDVPSVIARAIAQGVDGLPDDVVAHLVRWYGNDRAHDAIAGMVRAEPALAARVCEGSPVIAAQLRYAAMFERAMTAEDIIMRRTELGATARASRSVELAAQNAIDHAARRSAAKAVDQGVRADSATGVRGSRSL
jgi:glycerol-3-phosphate dehydrogenase